MLLLAMTLASSQLPAFSPGLAAAQCVDENDAHDFDAQAECLKSLIRDHREVSAVHRFAKPVLRAEIDRCVTDYSDGEKSDWNMIQICANRDEASLRETSLGNTRFDAERARVRCAKEQKEDRPDLVLEDCFKYEIIGARNFTLFQAIYPDAAIQSSFRICLERWTADNLTDWGMVFYCAQDQLDGLERLAPRGNR
ncbi:hypothetical protein SAMN05428974_0132 [Sphingopyxis sp. YR583]|jgi:hypothetical protein|uniref:hypothetical protein n=1 Tax=Sphingopyxis sp. YR583 TaxID=1881047 RepID=UPI0008A740C7|nr:hypothetical protein [Sphingopyxis sp. YR583]SEH11077.1 hypothetical protein SAMN05428974_0132 [Sphingopyxis sp. YR583]